MSAVDTQMLPSEPHNDFTSSSMQSTTNAYTDSRYHYVVTAHKPTAVKQSVLGNIVKPTSTSNGSSTPTQHLVTARSNVIDIYTVHTSPDSQPTLALLHTFTIHAIIADIVLLPLPSSPHHHLLFILTETNLYSIVQLQPTLAVHHTTSTTNNYSVHTLVRGSLQQKLVTPSTENGPFIVVDHSNRYVIVHTYSGLLQVLDLSMLYSGNATNAVRLCRIDEYHIESICQLSKDSNQNLCLAILYVDTHDRRYIKFYELKLDAAKNIFTARSLTGDGPASGIPVDATTTHILPTKPGSSVNGLIAVSEEQIAYIPFSAVTSVTPQSPATTRSTSTTQPSTSSSSQQSPSPNNPNNYTLSQYYKHFKVIDMSPAEITCFTMIDSTRYLLGDLAGNLYVIMLQLSSNGSSVIGVQYDILGAISIAQSLTYIGNGLVFIGSVYNDSQLVRLNSDLDEAGTYITPLHSIPNIGPISDMTLTTIDSQSQLLTCSGAYRDGSLRIIKQGISVREEASLDVEGVTTMYGLTNSSAHQSYLLLSFLNESRILATSTEDESLEEVNAEGFDLSQPTIYASEVLAFTAFLQITPTSVRVIDATSLQLLHQHQHSSTTNTPISVACHSNSTVVLAAGKQLTALNVSSQGIQVVNQLLVDHEVACVTVNNTAAVVAIGLWQSNTIQLLALPSLQLLHTEAMTVAPHAEGQLQTQGDTLPRSILFGTFGSQASADDGKQAATTHLFVGLGDGHLLSWQCQASSSAVQLSNRKLVQLGNQPLFLKSFQQHSTNTQLPSQAHVFVSCDRPHVISSSHGKLLYTPVHLRDVITITNFYTPAFQHCIAFITKAQLIIGRLDSIQKLHIKSIPMNEQVHRIAYVPTADAYAIASINYGGVNALQSTLNDVPELSLSPGIASVTNTPVSSSSSSSALQRKDSHSTPQQPPAFDSTASNTAKHLNSTLINNIVPELHHIRLYSRSNDYQPVADLMLNPNEYVGALTVLKLGVDRTVEYVVVGTGYNQLGDNYVQQGRLLLLDTDMNIVCETAVKGQVYCLETLHSDRIVVGINSRVEVYQVNSNAAAGNDDIIDTDDTLSNTDLYFQLQVSHKSHVDVVTLDVVGDYIVLGDILQSIKLLRYKSLAVDEITEGTTSGSYKKSALLEQVACDYDANSMVAVTALSTDTFLGSDGTFNLLAMRRNFDAMTDDDRHQLQVIGRYHLGDQINCFTRGSLVQRHEDASAQSSDSNTAEADKANGKSEVAAVDLSTVVPTHLFGTLSGMIGVVASLTRAQYQLLVSIEDAIRKTLPSVAHFHHADYRAFKNERRTINSTGFIDGDLIESVLELPIDQQQQIAVTVGLSVPELTEKLEDLTRIH